MFRCFFHYHLLQQLLGFGFVLLGFFVCFVLNFLPNSLEPFWDTIEITVWRFQTKPLNPMTHLSSKEKSFRGFTEPAPEYEEIWALVGEILTI